MGAKKLLLISVALFAFSFAANGGNIHSAKITDTKKPKTVYICTGKSSKCYHSSSSCRGLNRCSGTIKSISLEKAKRMGRRPCKICYK